MSLLASDAMEHRELRVPQISRGEPYFFGRRVVGGPLQLYGGADAQVVLSEDQELDVGVGAFIVQRPLASRVAVGRYAAPCERVHRVIASVTLRDYPGLGGPARESVLAQLRFDPGPATRGEVLAAETDRVGADELTTLSAGQTSDCGAHVFGASLAAGGGALFVRTEAGGITRVLGEGDALPGTTETVSRVALEETLDTVAIVRVTTASGVSLWRVPFGGTPACVAGPASIGACVVTATTVDHVAATHDETALVGTAADGRQTLWTVPDIARAPQLTLSFDTEPRFRAFAEIGYDTSTSDLYFLGRLDGPHDVWAVRADGGDLAKVTDLFTALGGAVPANVVGARQMSVGPRGWIALLTENDRVEGTYVLSPDGRLARGPAEGDTLPLDLAGATMVVDRFVLAPGTASHAGAIEDGVLVLRAISTDGHVALYRAGWPADDCVPQTDVNTVDDGEDANPGDGRCDTGSTLPDGEPECSLRAAIEEANASPEPDRIRFALEPGEAHVLRPDRELPEITAPVTIDGAGHDVTLDGGDAGDVSGLSCLTDGGCEIRSMTIRGFARDGIFSAGAELRVVDARVAEQCGWGIYAEGAVTLERSEVTGNGSGSGCEAGGVFAARASADGLRVSVRLVDARVEGNGGAGVLTSGNVILERATVARNAGEGLAIWPASGTGGRAREALRVEHGASVVEANEGHGVYADAEATTVEASGSLALRDNGGWGLYARSGAVRFGEAGPGGPSSVSEISRNGVGASCASWELALGTLAPERSPEPCGGGGVFSAASRGLQLESVRIEANDGPGILCAARVQVEAGVEILDNRGDGVACASPVGHPVPAECFRAELGAPVIADNLGHGIRAQAGDVVVAAGVGLLVSGNGAGGIDAVDDVVLEARAGVPVTPERRISANGGGATCHSWTVDDVDLRPRDDGDAACPPGAGIRTERSASVRARQLVCRDNAGDGIETGDLDLATAQLCGNGDQPIDATGTQQLVDVSFTCP